MNTFRLFAYLGFCVGTGWAVSNTPLGEWAIEKLRFVEVPPATKRSPQSNEEFWRRVRHTQYDSARKIHGDGNVADPFEGMAMGETRVLTPVAPAGIDPNSTSQKINI